MSQVALNTRNLSVNEKIAKGRTVLTAAGSVDGVSVLGAPAPSEVGVLLAKTDALETARNDKLTADNESKVKTASQLAAEKEWDEAVAAYGRVGQTKSTGIAAKIEMIGLSVAAEGAPVGQLAAPTNMHASTGDMTGEVDLGCDARKGARTYIWQICNGDPNVPANWQALGQGTKSTKTAKHLTTGTQPWFRVAVLGSGDDNQSPWSDPAQGLVA